MRKDIGLKGGLDVGAILIWIVENSPANPPTDADGNELVLEKDVPSDGSVWDPNWIYGLSFDIIGKPRSSGEFRSTKGSISVYKDGNPTPVISTLY